jgi:hypothetical protein
MDRDGGNVQLSTSSSLIQRLNIFQPVFKPVTAQIDFILRDCVEHECVVRIGRMSKRKDFSGILRHAEFENGRDNLVKANCQSFKPYSRLLAIQSAI